MTYFQELGRKLREHHKAIENEVLCLKEQAPDGMDTFAEVAKAISDLSNTIDEINTALNDKVPVTRTVNNKALSSDITLSAADVGADASGSAANQITSHNISTASHNDIRALITGLNNRLNALADSDDTTLDQLSELVAYIKDNRELIEGITTNKVNVSDIVDNLTTNVSNKVLSAAQGVALKTLIDALQTSMNSKAETTALENYLLKDARATSASMLFTMDHLTTSIITKAEGLTPGMYYIGLGGTEYTGEDLPSDPNWEYASAIVTVRDIYSKEILLLNETQGLMAINTYSGSTWSGWKVFASKDDLATTLTEAKEYADSLVNGLINGES